MAVRDEQNQPVPHDGQQNWKKGENREGRFVDMRNFTFKMILK